MIKRWSRALCFRPCTSSTAADDGKDKGARLKALELHLDQLIMEPFAEGVVVEVKSGPTSNKGTARAGERAEIYQQQHDKHLQLDQAAEPNPAPGLSLAEGAEDLPSPQACPSSIHNLQPNLQTTPCQDATSAPVGADTNQAVIIVEPVYLESLPEPLTADTALHGGRDRDGSSKTHSMLSPAPQGTELAQTPVGNSNKRGIHSPGTQPSQQRPYLASNQAVSSPPVSARSRLSTASTSRDLQHQQPHPSPLPTSPLAAGSAASSRAMPRARLSIKIPGTPPSASSTPRSTTTSRASASAAGPHMQAPTDTSPLSRGTPRRTPLEHGSAAGAAASQSSRQPVRSTAGHGGASKPPVTPRLLLMSPSTANLHTGEFVIPRLDISRAVHGKNGTPSARSARQQPASSFGGASGRYASGQLSARSSTSRSSLGHSMWATPSQGFSSASSRLALQGALHGSTSRMSVSSSQSSLTGEKGLRNVDFRPKWR